jgi:hypothetical protein
MDERKRLLVVALYAAAMAWVEAAVVVYLRTMIGRVVPYQPDPLPLGPGGFGYGLAWIELVREVATLVMLATTGWLAGRTVRSRSAYAVFAFGVWDILYYAFLYGMCGWPASLLDWDILFLLPLPWWGPVAAPVAIAALTALCGALISQHDRPDRPVWPARRSVALGLAGAALALYVFMADALVVAGRGVGALRTLLPVWFNWPLFAVALALLAVPVVEVMWRLEGRRPRLSEEARPRPSQAPMQ